MPGIAGIFANGPRQEHADALVAMLESLRHQADLKSDNYHNETVGLSAGWVRARGGLPPATLSWNETHDIGIIFLGEVLSDSESVPPGSEASGWMTDDTVPRIHQLYEKSGLGFLSRLNGWFSGLVIDLRERKLTLFNDRFGVGRLYYHESPSGFYFSSEAKALLRVMPRLRALAPKSLGEFLSLGCVLQNRTLFNEIFLLPPGSAWTIFPDGRVQKQSYFTPSAWEQLPALSPDDYYEKLRGAWQKLLPKYFQGGRPAALSLTGGVDSRLILAWARQAAGKLPCYTFGGRYRDCADVSISRKVAARSGQKHHVIPIGAGFLAQFPTLAEQCVKLSDGTMEVIGSIDLYVQQQARNIAPVRVTGTNGGEIMRSLVAFKPMPLAEEMFEPDFLPFLHDAAETYSKELKGNPLTFTAFKQTPWYMNSKFVVERSEVTLRMPYFDNDLVSLIYQAPVEATRNNDLSLRLIAEGNPDLAKLPTDRGIAPSLIPGVVRARRFWQECTFKADYAYDYGMPQWLAKTDHVFAPFHLERLFLGRHKFHHFRVFYRDELSDYVRNLLLDPQASGRSHLRRSSVERIVNSHLNGTGNYTLELHKLLSTELIHRTLLTQN